MKSNMAHVQSKNNNRNWLLIKKNIAFLCSCPPFSLSLTLSAFFPPPHSLLAPLDNLFIDWPLFQAYFYAHFTINVEIIDFPLDVATLRMRSVQNVVNSLIKNIANKVAHTVINANKII